MDVSDIIMKWGGVTAFASEVGCAPATANHWRMRNSIPGEWVMAVSRAAIVRGFAEITPDFLAHRAELRRLSRLAERDRTRTKSDSNAQAAA